MPAYNSRRGLNVSQYIQDLNAINPQEPAAEENFNMQDGLAIFTNTEFFDFDSGQNTDFQAAPAKPNVKAESSSTTSGDASAAQSVMGEMPDLEFLSNDFSFPDFNHGYSAAPGPAMTGFEGSPNFPSVPPTHGPQNYGNHHMTPQAHSYSQDSTPAPQTANGEKHKADGVSSGNSTLNFEESSRHAADEDKRRRNTAASARFRVKKKQREQALEKSAKDMTEKVTTLESKVSQLETENKWLKNLLVEKNEGNDNIATMWKEFTKQASEKLKAAESSKR